MNFKSFDQVSLEFDWDLKFVAGNKKNSFTGSFNRYILSASYGPGSISAVDNTEFAMRALLHESQTSLQEAT